MDKIGDILVVCSCDRVYPGNILTDGADEDHELHGWFVEFDAEGAPISATCGSCFARQQGN